MKDKKIIIIVVLTFFVISLGSLTVFKFIKNGKEKNDLNIDMSIVKPLTINVKLNNKEIKLDYNKLFEKEMSNYLASSLIKGEDNKDYFTVINYKNLGNKEIEVFIINDNIDIIFDEVYNFPSILDNLKFADKYNKYSKYPYNISNDKVSVLQDSINGDNKELLEYNFIINDNIVSINKVILGDQYEIFVER